MSAQELEVWYQYNLVLFFILWSKILDTYIQLK